MGKCLVFGHSRGWLSSPIGCCSAQTCPVFEQLNVVAKVEVPLKEITEEEMKAALKEISRSYMICYLASSQHIGDIIQPRWQC